MSKKELTQDDFRRLLATPARGSKPSDSSAQKSAKKASSGSKPHKPFFKPKPKGPQHRDRAAERREGKVLDYDGIADDIQQDTLSGVDHRKVIEESKYLGGDMSHTHLVKGLDYLLLNKIRSEQVHDEEVDAVQQLEQIERKLAAEKPVQEEQTAFSISTPIGNAIHSTLFETPPAKTDFFLPGHSAFVFTLNDDEYGSELPTTLMRSKTAFPDLEEQVSARIAHDLLLNVSKVLSYIKKSSLRTYRKLKKQEKSKRKHDTDKKVGPGADDIGLYEDEVDAYSGPTAAAAVPAEKKTIVGTDIFSDGPEKGEDILLSAVNSQWNASAHAMAVGKKARAAAARPLVDAPPPPQGHPQGPPPAQAPDPAASEAAQLKQTMAAARYDRDLDDMDSDEEEELDLRKMDTGTAKSSLRPWDFADDDAYGKYQQNREALPKAAFQFGVKMANGRKTKKDSRNQEQKMKRQLHEIEKMIENRSTDGNLRKKFRQDEE